MDLTIDILTSQNPILWVASGLAAASSVLVFLRVQWALPVLFLWISIADFLKRLLFLGTSGVPTEGEYFWILALPDFILAASLARVATEVLRRRSLPWRRGTLDYLVAGFVAWSTVELLNPTFPLEIRLAGFKSSTIYVLVYFLARAVDAQDERWFKRLLPILLVTGLVAGLYAIYQGEVGFLDFELEWLGSGLTQLGGGGEGELGETIAWFGIVRPFSTFASHEQLGWYLGFVVMMMIGLRIRGRRGWAGLVLLMVAIARTLSRSSWVFLGSSLLFAALVGFRMRSRVLSRDVPIAILVLLASVAFWTLSSDRAYAGAYADRASALGSYEWRIYSVQELIDDPSWRRLLGNGIGSMWVAWRLGAPGTLNPDERILSHIGTIDIIYELGIIGFMIFAATIAYILWRVWGIANPISGFERTDFPLVAAAIVVGVVLANSTVATVLMFRPIAAPFWLSMGAVGGFFAAEQKRSLVPDSSH